mgnify:CR=1 FL=1
MKTTITVASVDILGMGEKDGNEWILYLVKDADGNEYKTFDHKYSEIVSQEIEIEYEEREYKGKKSFQIVQAKKQNHIDRIKEMHAMVKVIHDYVVGQMDRSRELDRDREEMLDRQMENISREIG